MSQNAAVLARLRQGPLTPREALDELGCFRLAARIHDLRAEGHLILAETVKAGGKSFARYRIIETAEDADGVNRGLLAAPSTSATHRPEPDEREEPAGAATLATTPAPGQLEVW